MAGYPTDVGIVDLYLGFPSTKAGRIVDALRSKLKDADSRAYAMEVTAKAIETMDWKKLMLISPGGFDAGQVIALAFQELAGNAQKIGELNISPDLLQGLMTKKRN